MEVRVLPRQTLPDVAMQVYGDIRGMVAIAEANGLAVSDDIKAGTILECPEIVYDKYMGDYVKDKKVSPATMLEDTYTRIFTQQFTMEFC